MTYGVSPFSSPREPHVCLVAGFPGQSDHVPAPSAVLATGASVRGNVAKENSLLLESSTDRANGKTTAAKRRLNRGAAVMLLYPLFGYRFIRPFSQMPK